jgi:hypothetical protein
MGWAGAEVECVGAEIRRSLCVGSRNLVGKFERVQCGSLRGRAELDGASVRRWGDPPVPKLDGLKSGNRMGLDWKLAMPEYRNRRGLGRGAAV